MTSPLLLASLGEDVELIADHSGQRAATVDCASYKSRIVPLAHEVFGVPTIYPKQAAALDSFVRNKLTVCYGAHGVGKDFLLAIAALYAAYVDEQLVLIISATERQLLGQVWRELTTMFGASPLPGKLYVSALEVAGEKRILAMTSGSTDRLTGWHHPNGVAVLISESQAEQVEDVAFDAAIANTVSEGSKVLVVGNPVKPVGRFYEICQKAHWSRVQISVFDHPNVIENRMVIGGGPTASWATEVAQEYGTESAYYQARVLGVFPTSGVIDALVTRSDVDRAIERHERGTLSVEANDYARRISADLARSVNGDLTCVATIKGPVVESIETLHSADLMVTAKLLYDRALMLGAVDVIGRAHPNEREVFDARAWITVDDAGLGGGVTDRLKELGARVTPFNGGETARVKPERYANRRAEAYMALRDKFLRNRIAIPNDPKLVEELLATTYSLTGAGKIMITPKDTIRSVLGRSPDRADALSMAYEPRWTVQTATVEM